MPAIHIFFPATFEIDADNTDSDAVTLTGTTQAGDPIALSGSPTFARDTSATYNADCQLDQFICFLIQWQMSTDITAGSRLIVETKNLKNPESIAKAGDVTITTLMKYTEDVQYYPIDTSS